MSVKDASKLYKTPFHQRHESDELDVFEAAGYFSGYNEATSLRYYDNNNNINGATHTIQKPARELLPENQYYHKQTNRRSLGGRMSLDVPLRNSIPQQAHSAILDKQSLKESSNNKYKQPSSPGGRLASFLNSLFNQAGSKNKNKKTKSSKDVVDKESPGGWRRRRRSSISHFRSSSTTNEIITTIATDKTPPPPCAPTSVKSYYKELRSFSDHLPHLKQVKLQPLDHHVKVKLSLGDAKSNGNEDDEAVMDDKAESDSSSDLFELQNYDLGLDVLSSGLPVYETTRMDSMKRGAPVIS